MAFATPPVRWVVRPPAPPQAVAALSRALEVPPSLAAVLWSRGLRDPDPTHLKPPLKLSPNPTLPLAAERVLAAIERRERILIHGDYDADGITGTAILLLGFKELGGNVEAFIPNRLTDGYGINAARVQEHAARADLLITVDCGVSNVREIAQLQELGVDVIVTDHHTPGDELPDTLVVHPGLSPLAGEGLPELTGAGVAFHLLWALRERLGESPPLDYSDLATLGTVADVAPLLGENRALILEGLGRLEESRWPGIRASVAQAKLSRGITARDVAFVLAPRLNAAGRLGEADVGLELLITRSETRASELAVYLDARNIQRRQIQDEAFSEALTMVDPEAPAIVLHDPDWHSGVIGIVASKLVEEFYKPVYLAAAGRGSVRSTPGISAVGALKAASAHLRGFGGHQQAAGFSLDMTEFGSFKAAVLEYVSGFPTPVPTVVTDALIEPSEITAGFYRSLAELEPYGEGHPEPLFALVGRLDAARAVGKERATLQLRVGGTKGVGWRMGELAAKLPVGAPVNAAVRLAENEWQNVRTVEFVVEAVRPAEPISLLGAEGGAEGQPLAASVRRAGDPLAGGPLIRELAAATATAKLGELLKTTGATLALDGAVTSELERAATEFPTLAELRSGLRAIMRGAPIPYSTLKAKRIGRALEELSLLDGAGRARQLPPGTRISPFEADSFLGGLIERYRLRTLVHAYRSLDDDGFAESVALLFGPGAALPTAEFREAEVHLS